jgi:hypothetical protein
MRGLFVKHRCCLIQVKHIRLPKRFTSKNSKKDFLVLRQKKRNESKKNSYFRCHYEGCNKSYTCQMYLSSHITKSHIQLNTKETNKICLLCNKKFDQVWQKRQHDQQVHRNLLIKCTHDNCTKTFRTKNNLKRHMKIHDREEGKLGSEKKFKCEHDNCKAEFNRHEHLITHSEMHSQEKKFFCNHPYCGSSFKFKTNLISHKKVHQVVPNPQATSSTLPPAQLVKNSSAQSIKPQNKEFMIVNLNLNQNQQNNAVSGGNNGSGIVKKIIKLNMISCNYCSLKFDSNESLSIHMKNHFESKK